MVVILGERHTAQSTSPNTSSGIPDEDAVAEIQNAHGCTIHCTLGTNDSARLVTEFEREES